MVKNLKNILLPIFLSIVFMILMGITVFAEDCLHQGAVDDGRCETALICPDCGDTVKEALTHDFVPVDLVAHEDGALYGITKYDACTNEGCGAKRTTTHNTFFEQVGYSISQDSISSSFYSFPTVLKAYAKFKNIKLDFGLIATSEKGLGGSLPLKADGTPNSFVKKSSFVGSSSFMHDIKINNVTSDILNEKFLICYYVILGDDIYYIQRGNIITSYEGLYFVSHNMFDNSRDEYGGFGTSQTVTSADRNKQMASSQADFNTGSDLSNINDVKNTANMVTVGGALANYPNASDLLSHFLDGSGSNYNLIIDTFLKDSVAKNNRNIDMNKAMSACEVLAQPGKSLTFYQVEESLFHNLEGDWKNALGSYFTSIRVENLVVGVDAQGNTIYSADFVYIVQDYYNWDANDTNKLFGLISPFELHQLHKAGLAKEFLTYGEKTFHLNWTKGERFDLTK
ncbi:MAG: hypothetical protein IJ309_06135 [Clostridia bacterium]|nr:hypothetical protein [Clostridia bacterium]